MTIKLAKINVGFAGFMEGAHPLGGPFWSSEFSLEKSFLDGVASGECDYLHMSERTIASATFEDLDLNGTSLLDPLAGPIAAVRLVGVFVMNRRRDPLAAANTTNITVGAGSNPATAGWLGGTTPTVGPIRPGGFFFMMNPDSSGMGAVTAGTADILRITNSAGAAAVFCLGLLLRSA